MIADKVKGGINNSVGKVKGSINSMGKARGNQPRIAWIRETVTITEDGYLRLCICSQ
jgi:hypothetical protein